MITFGMEISGLKQIETEYAQFCGKLDAQFEPILKYVGSEMTNLLKQHIASDWYERYEPINYRRRTDMGLPNALGADSRMYYQAQNGGLYFEYMPLGNPTRGFNRANGDRLIRIIQDGTGGGWDGIVPPRPYWNNFVEDLENGTLIDMLEAGAAYTGADFRITDASFGGEAHYSRFVDLSEFKL